MGHSVRWFAYPYVAADGRAKAIVREAGYDGACGGLDRVHEPYYLTRVDVALFTLPQLRLRSNGLFCVARQFVRSVRLLDAPRRTLGRAMRAMRVARRAQSATR